LLSALRAARWTSDELTRLRDWIASIRHPGECRRLLEAAAHERGCPYCGCECTHRCSKASGLQRFRCLGCRGSDNALTGTLLARLRLRGHWLTCLQCLLDSRTVRAAARTTGVHRTNSFRWRHRLCTVSCAIGWPVLPALASSLGPVVAPESLLISDSAAAYRRFTGDAGIRHEWVNTHAGERKRGDIHIQYVNGWHARFKGWLIGFRGVASRYLAHSTGWQRILDTAKLTTPAQLLVVAVLLW
jgi:transposase-like protein